MSSSIHFLAAASSDEIFKSMGESMNSGIEPMHVVSVVAGLIAIIALLTLFNRRQSTPAAPKALNNTNKLTRELAKAIGLKRSEYKRLKQLADREGIEHALALLLCPSVLKRSLHDGANAGTKAIPLPTDLIKP